LLPWWKYFGTAELWTLALRHKERLVGLAPFFIKRSDTADKGSVLLIGTGISDYLDVLLDTKFESQKPAQY
jgi:hypothetical protein